jgi:DHA2 family multidrug resistance protein
MRTESKLIVFVAVLASLLEIIDTSIVNVALPTMMGNLGATLEDISMVITGYAIANAIVLPLSAWLGERIGRRKYYLGCITAFTITSVACGLAPNLFTLIIFRIFQGLMGGALLPTSQTLIYEQFPKEKAGMAGAIFGMSVMIGPTLGPVMGGYLTDSFGWRSIFNINLPLGLLALFVGMICIHDRANEDGHKQSRELDIWGLVFLTLGVGCLQYVLERGESEDWFSSWWIIINTTAFTLSIPAFIWWELRVKNPIMNLRLFKNPVVTYGVSLMAGLGFFLYGVVFILPVFVARVFHYDATQTGQLFIPGSLLTALMMPFIGKQMQRGTDPKLLIFIGLTAIELCLFLMTRFSTMTSYSEMMVTLYVRGFAMAFLFVPINSSILSQFKGIDMGQVAGMLNLFRQIGGSMGIALIATLLSANSHQNYLDLVSKISLLNPSTMQIYMQSQAGLAGKMSDSMGMASPLQATLRTLYYRVQNQVFMMSFLQLVWVIMIVFSLSFLALWRIRFKSKSVVVMDSH